MRIAFVSREFYPLTGGGIGQFVAAAAAVLSADADVTVLTTSRLASQYESLAQVHDARMPPANVRMVFVPEPTWEESQSWSSSMHCYSARVLTSLRESFPDGGPELVEFADYLGEGFVPLQASLADDPLFSATRIVVRVHTTAEICAVLDGFWPSDVVSHATFDLERGAMTRADHLIWQGGDIRSLYERYYRGLRLPPWQLIPYPYHGPDDTDSVRRIPTSDGILRILYAGRLERRKGVRHLVRSVTGSRRQDVHLTLMGSDTPTGPLGTSMRELLESEAAGDPRIALVGEGSRETVAQAIREHHVVAVPSLWECWPYAALEALHLNRPVVGTPVGGLVDIVQEGESGWLADDVTELALRQRVESLSVIDVDALIASGKPRDFGRRLANEAVVREAYAKLAASPRPRPQRRGHSPLVSVIVPYFRASRWARDTLTSLAEQTYTRLEVLIVNDGSFEKEDELALGEALAGPRVTVITQMNTGLGAARNLGIKCSSGKYVFPLDADNVAHPEFVARCVDLLERHPDVSYVTTWSRYVNEDGKAVGAELGFQPMGNEFGVNERTNLAGDAAAVFRRRLFDIGFEYSDELCSFEDWHLFRWLAAKGYVGAVIPERLMDYRVRRDSMQATVAVPRRERLEGEIAALLREEAVRWKSQSV